MVETVVERVVHVCHAVLPFTETFLLPRLARGAFEPAILTWRVCDLRARCACPVVVVRELERCQRLPRRAADILGAARETLHHARALRCLRPSVVHAHFGHVGIRVDRACRLLGVPLVVSFYGVDVGALPRLPQFERAFRRLFRNAAAFTCEGPAMARALIALGAPPARVKLLPIAVAAPAKPSPRPAPSSSLRLLQVARFTPKKGIDVSLRAVALARAMGADVRITIGGDGEERGLLHDLSRTLGIEDVVDWLGFVEHARLDELFAACDAVIQPSRVSEDGDTEGGAPTFLLEAMAHGVPVFSTRHADIPTVVRDEKTGLLVDEDDVEALARCLVQVSLDPRLLARLGPAARQAVQRRHDPARTMRLQERVYRRAIAGWRG